MILDPEQKIARPKQLYIGADRRDYIALAKRA
jgi:citrate synthase